MGEFSIRQAAIDDYEAICRLAREMDRLHRAGLPDRFREHDGPARARDYVAGLIADPGTFLAVAVRDGRVVGIINSGLGDTPEVPVKVRRKFLKVRGVVVDPSVRRRGVGRALVEAAAAWAKGRGAAELQLNVYDFNEAGRAFFTRLGFAPLSHRLSRRL